MCSIRKNIDYVGNDLTRVNGAKPEDCCDACHNTPGCRAYSWSDDQGGSCWLKSKVTQVVFKAGVHSAGAYPSEHPQCDNVQRGVDYLGNDIGNTRSSTPEGCCDFCETTPNCRVYSWTDYEGGTCWLKSRSGNVSYTDGVFSAQVMDDPDDHCMYRYDTDYEGSDIANVPGKDTYECCAICKGHAGCAYFGWTDFNGGTCWLKSSAGHVVAKNGVQSGFVRL